MRVLKPGKPWSTEITCRGCTSILRITADTLEFRDVKLADLGIGFTCTACDSKEVITIDIPPAVDELVKKRRGIAPKRPEIIKKAMPKNFNMICGNCEAELLIEPQDIQLQPPDSYRTSCAACLNVIELPLKNVPDEVRELLQTEAMKKTRLEVLFDESEVKENPDEASNPTLVVKSRS